MGIVDFIDRSSNPSFREAETAELFCTLDKSPVSNLPMKPFRHGIEADIKENPMRTSCHASAGTKPMFGGLRRKKWR